MPQTPTMNPETTLSELHVEAHDICHCSYLQLFQDAALLENRFASVFLAHLTAQSIFRWRMVALSLRTLLVDLGVAKNYSTV